MPRYIDADWIVQKLEGWQDQLAETYGENDEYVLCLGEVLMKLDDTPTADVVERKRGKWIKSNESVLRPYMCSKCGALFDVDTVLGKLSWQYCPACGTEMEGEDDE